MLHRAVDRVFTEQTSPSPESSAIIHLRCKNFLICSFNIPNQADCRAVARSIERLSNLSKFLFGEIEFDSILDGCELRLLLRKDLSLGMGNKLFDDAYIGYPVGNCRLGKKIEAWEIRLL